MWVAMTPRGGFFATILGVVVAAAVSFLISAVILKASKDVVSGQSLESAKLAVKEMKAAGVKAGQIGKISVSCDAGMGSSAMGASLLRNKLKQAGLTVQVVNTSIEEIPADADLVITHASLTVRAMQAAPKAEHISLDNFVDTPVYDLLVERLKEK